jgi:hypothetical protein
LIKLLNLAGTGGENVGTAGGGNAELPQSVEQPVTADTESSADPAPLAQWSGLHDADDAVVDGVYINGEATGAAELPLSLDNANAPVAVAGTTIETDLGSNQAQNVGLIVDANGADLTQIVLGDHFTTNIIVQTNVLVDDDCIETAGGGGTAVSDDSSHGVTVQGTGGDDHPLGNYDGEIGVLTQIDVAALVGAALSTAQGDNEVDGATTGVFSGDNVVENAAYFSSETYDAPLKFGKTGSLTVDIVHHHGNYVDLQTLLQKNIIADNDVVVQQSTSAYYSSVSTGDNVQANFAYLQDWGTQYSLTVIGGDYYSLNAIMQTNIVVDDDFVTAVADYDDPVAQSVNTGQNSLSNTAAITEYGSGDFQGLSDELASLSDSLLNGSAIDPSQWWDLAGSATGYLRVLVVTGDYFDLDVILQQSIVIDVDTAVQYFGVDPNADESPASFVSTGANVATNIAQIIDFGTAGTSYIGGDHYDDAILVQGNLISDDDQLSVWDTQTLVSEIVAFTGDEISDEPEPTQPTGGEGLQLDMLGNLLN